MNFFRKKPTNRITIVQKERKPAPKSFFDLSSKEQKQVIKSAAIEANEAQQKLEAEYKKMCAKCS